MAPTGARIVGFGAFVRMDSGQGPKPVTARAIPVPRTGASTYRKEAGGLPPPSIATGVPPGCCRWAVVPPLTVLYPSATHALSNSSDEIIQCDSHAAPPGGPRRSRGSGVPAIQTRRQTGSSGVGPAESQGCRTAGHGVCCVSAR